MIIVGLTGGVATGKSTVARMFQDCGAAVIDADVLARHAVEPGKPAWRDIIKTFGRNVLQSDRTLDRKALAGMVFRDRRKLRRLNAIVHPRVAREQSRLAGELARTRAVAVVIYDAPVLIEAGAHRRMQRLIVVTADPASQVARLQKRNRLSRPEALRRIKSQLPLSKKVKFADYVLDGTQPRPRLRRQVRKIYDELRRLAATTVC